MVNDARLFENRSNYYRYAHPTTTNFRMASDTPQMEVLPLKLFVQEKLKLKPAG